MVNVFQAKTELSKLLSALEEGREDEIVIARNGKPVAKLLRWDKIDSGNRIGAAKGKFNAPVNLDLDNGAIEGLFAAEKP